MNQIIENNIPNEIDYIKNKSLAEYFYEQLWTEESKYVRDYIYSRGINDSTIKDFQLGWCPSNWNGETKWWNHRLMVPLIDSHNNYISFHTRIITKKITDKYNNIFILEEKTNKIVKEIFSNGEKKEYTKTWFHGIFEKNCYLFGLNITKEYIEKENSVIIVEGIFDALSLYENGIKNVVAVLGSSLTKHQECLLARYCDKHIYLFDSDEGGYTGALRASKKSHYKNEVLYLPNNYDPHDFILNYGIEPIKKVLLEKGLMSI